MTIDDILGRLIFIQSHAPNFPEERQMNTATALHELMEAMSRGQERLKSRDQRRWIRIAIKEVEQAANAYLNGDADQGRESLNSAEQHFRNALDGKRLRATFIADASGGVQALEPREDEAGEELDGAEASCEPALADPSDNLETGYVN